jgi:hypothetical protein
MKLLDEIGEINDHIKLKQGIMQILLWLVEDESLGDAIVTITTGI